MVMKLKFHGVRGSRPVHKKALLGFGGNSTSLEFELDEDFYLFLDGGSGIARRGRELTERPEKKEFHCLITHTHWDHILGFPFFEPLYNEENRFTFYSSTTSKSTFNDLFWGLHRADNLPVPVSKLKADINFKAIKPNEEFMINNKVKIKTFQLNHQGVTLGYRVEHNEDSVCVITDNAPIENGNYLGENMSQSPDDKFEKAFNEGLVNFLKDANTVVFDTHFNEGNLKPDWGHTTPSRAFDFCLKAGVSRLILFHHAPEDSDDDVKEKVKSLEDKTKGKSIEVVAACEGDLWDLRSA